MKPRRPNNPQPSRWPPFVLGLASLIFLLFAARHVAIMWFETPAGRHFRMRGSDRMEKAIRAARLSDDATLRESLAIISNSRDLLRAYQQQEAVTEIRTRILANTRTKANAITRLQLLAWDLQALRLGDMPLADRAERITPFIKRLPKSIDSHHMTLLIDRVAEAYQTINLPAGMARLLATEYVGTINQAFLQIFARDAVEMINALRESDPEAASILAHRTGALFTKWLCDPGPPTLRILCADLLARNADVLYADALTPDEISNLRTELAAVRSVYHADQLQRTLTAYPLIATHSGLDPAPRAMRRAARTLVHATCSFVVTALWTIIGAILCVFAVIRPQHTPLRSTLLYALLLTIATIVIVTLSLTETGAPHAINSYNMQTFHIPMHLLLTALPALVIGLIIGKRAKCGGPIVAAAAILMAISTIVFAQIGRSNLHRYDRDIAIATRTGFTTPLPPDGVQIDEVCAILDSGVKSRNAER